jgi:hypothetical protein
MYVARKQMVGELSPREVEVVRLLARGQIILSKSNSVRIPTRTRFPNEGSGSFVLAENQEVA